MPFGLGIISSIQSIINRNDQKDYNAQQQNNWERQFEYQKWLNNKQMEREDTAWTRQIQDLQRNGINKLQALGGSGAASGGMTTYSGNAGGQAPQTNVESSPQILGMIQDIKESNARIEQTKADTELTKKQTLHEESKKINTEMNTLFQSLQKDFTATNIKKVNEEIKLKAKEYEALQNDLNVAQRWEIPTGVDPRVNNPWEAASQLVNLLAAKMGVKLDEGTAPADNSKTPGKVSEAGKKKTDNIKHTKGDKKEQDKYINDIILTAGKRGTKAQDIVNKFWDSIPGEKQKDKMKYVMNVLEAYKGSH